MSLLVTALLAAGGALAAGASLRLLKKRSTRHAEAEPPTASAPTLPPGFELELGDVIGVRHEEAWLEHAWVLSEAGEPVAAVLFAHHRVVIALPQPRSTLYWVEPLDLHVPAEPPSSLELDGARYERALRRPVTVQTLRQPPDPPWQEALLAEYRGLAGESLWLLGRSGAFQAWRGQRVSEQDYERWGGGARTFEP